MLIGKILNSQKLQRSYLQSIAVFSFAQAKAKKSAMAPSSTSIVDPFYFQKTSFFGKLINKYKNYNTLADCERTFGSFKKAKFSDQYIVQYNNFVDLYNKRQTKQVENFLSDDNFKLYKSAVKSGAELPYGQLQKAKSMEIVQARVNSIYLTVFKASNQWFQFTCKFKSENGQEYYHIIERNQTGKFFKLIKLNLL